MTEESNNTVSCKWSMEEREKILTTGTLEQKKEAFRDDEELMKETTKFVSDVIQTAISEASKRKMEVCNLCSRRILWNANLFITLILCFRKVMIVKVIIKKKFYLPAEISSEKHIVKKRYILDRFLFQNLFFFIIFFIIKIFVCVGSRLKGIGSITGWNRRARGFCSRIFNALCPCFTSNGKS